MDGTRSPHQTTLAVTNAVETWIQIVPTYPGSNEILTCELAVNEHKVSVQDTVSIGQREDRKNGLLPTKSSVINCIYTHVLYTFTVQLALYVHTYMLHTLHMYMYIYVHVHVRIYVYVRICIYTCMYVSEQHAIGTHIYTCMCSIMHLSTDK